MEKKICLLLLLFAILAIHTARAQACSSKDGEPEFDRPSDQFDTPFFTTNSGAPVDNVNSSLTVGVRGPTLLEDFFLVEKLAHFDRERIPERVVHARGVSAKGYFEVTHDVSNLTSADFLKAVGEKTEVVVRFSTVTHERGSPETLRDARGFAVKFYTHEGNYDMVGNNMPVFFIRDGIKFPDLIHASKPNPRSNYQQKWRILDFLSHHPESLNMLTYVLDDIGIPLSYRHMEGFAVHTFKLINKQGKETYVKFHWKPRQGVKSLATNAEVLKVGGLNHQHATQDLYDTIAKGDFPVWDLYIQTMDPATEAQYDFDPLDSTQVWPEALFPLQPVGSMVLNKNVDNFFTDSEQLAFSPGVLVPGITYSDDKLLQARIFAYSDTQRYRLGANYLLLPVNAPRCPYHNGHFDGEMNFMHRESEVNYFPSRKFPAVNRLEEQQTSRRPVQGVRTKQVIPKENNFQQPGERYRSFDAARQERFRGRFVEWLTEAGVTDDLRSIWVSFWSQCDVTLGKQLQAALNNMSTADSNNTTGAKAAGGKGYASAPTVEKTRSLR